MYTFENWSLHFHTRKHDLCISFPTPFFCWLTDPPQNLCGRELCSIPLLERQWSRQEKTSEHRSFLHSLCTHRWTARDKAVNSTSSGTVLPQETGNHSYGKTLDCTRKEIFRAERCHRKKNFAGWPSKILPLTNSHFMGFFSWVWVRLLQDFIV